MSMFIWDSQYEGDLYVVYGDALSKYARKKLLNLTRGYGFVKTLKDYGDKVYAEIYYMDFCGMVPVNLVSTEMIEKSDIRLLDWNYVLELHNEGNPYIVKNYLHYLEIYNTSATVWGNFSDPDKRYGIYHWPDSFDADKAIVLYPDYETSVREEPKWMIEQVESGKLDLDKHIAELKRKYGYTK